MKDTLRIGVVNMQVASGKTEENLAHMLAVIAEAARAGASMLLFPELCLQGYDYYVDPGVSEAERRAQAITTESPQARALSQAAVENGLYVVYGAAERDAQSGLLYNAAFAACPDGAQQVYRKIHPFGDENRAFAKGDAPLLLQTPWGPVGIGICYDTYQFPELMRYYASKGARLYLNPTALSEETDKPGSREAFLRYYRPTLEYGVLANTIFIASANLTGQDTLHRFGGGSMVIGPAQTPFFETDVACYGGSADDTRPGTAYADIDLSLATRRLFVENPLTGEPDFRPGLYRSWE